MPSDCEIAAIDRHRSPSAVVLQMLFCLLTLPGHVLETLSTRSCPSGGATVIQLEPSCVCPDTAQNLHDDPRHVQVLLEVSARYPGRASANRWAGMTSRPGGSCALKPISPPASHELSIPSFHTPPVTPCLNSSLQGPTILKPASSPPSTTFANTSPRIPRHGFRSRAFRLPPSHHHLRRQHPRGPPDHRCLRKRRRRRGRARPPQAPPSFLPLPATGTLTIPRPRARLRQPPSPPLPQAPPPLVIHVLFHVSAALCQEEPPEERRRARPHAEGARTEPVSEPQPQPNTRGR